jgi:hypothetical protein
MCYRWYYSCNYVYYYNVIDRLLTIGHPVAVRPILSVPVPAVSLGPTCGLLSIVDLLLPAETFASSFALTARLFLVALPTELL